MRNVKQNLFKKHYDTYLRSKPLQNSVLHCSIDIQTEVVGPKQSIVKQVVSFDTVIFQLLETLVSEILEITEHFTSPLPSPSKDFE